MPYPTNKKPKSVKLKPAKAPAKVVGPKRRVKAMRTK